MCAIISSEVLKGPNPRPFFRSSSDSSSRALMMRRWAGVYSSSALGNWARSITNLGVMTILPRWKAKFTRSPLDNPAWRRTLVGIVTWPLCWILAVVLCGWGRWRRVAAPVRASTPGTEGREVEAWRSVRKKAAQEGRPTGARRWFEWGGPPGLPSAVSSNAKLEPGVFGVFRPVLWLPAGIGDRLEDAE